MTQADRAAVEMIGITKRFGETVANDHIDFVASAGEVHALIGENGAGKSTLMSILAGMYRPDEGCLRIDGRDAEFRSPRDAIAAGIGMVYQHFMLVDSFTVAENVLLGRPDEPFALDTGRVEQELAELSRRYGLGIDPRAHIWQLSVGEQQRVEIIRLLHRGANILVFDEPTAVLTPQEAEELIRTLRGMAAEGFAVIFISHKLNEVMAVADRITVLRRGKTVATLRPSETNRGQLARLMVGRELAQALLAEEGAERRHTGRPVLEIAGLHARNDKRLPALAGVDLTVHAGEIFGIAGVAGNGQRELAEVITGLRPASSGTVTIAGRPATNRPPREIARAGVAHIPEDRLGTGLVGTLDLANNAIMRAYEGPPIARGPFLVARAIARFANRLITDYNVGTPGRATRVGDLSGGNQQKLLLARELVGEPKVIVAVHPTRGVDVGASEAIHAVLRAQRARGAAILLISEDLDELLTLSDRVGVLYEGTLMGTVDARGADPERIGLMMAGTPGDRIDAAPAHAKERAAS